MIRKGIKWTFIYGCVCLATLFGSMVANGGVQEPCSLEAMERVQSVTFSVKKYPRIKAHVDAAIRDGWPRTLRLKRIGADRRRDVLLDRQPKQPKGDGLDQDEYPPAVGRSSWRASVRLVPERENRSHGATLGNRLDRFCEGQRFRYRWR